MQYWRTNIKQVHCWAHHPFIPVHYAGAEVGNVWCFRRTEVRQTELWVLSASLPTVFRLRRTGLCLRHPHFSRRWLPEIVYRTLLFITLDFFRFPFLVLFSFDFVLTSCHFFLSLLLGLFLSPCVCYFIILICLNVVVALSHSTRQNLSFPHPVLLMHIFTLAARLVHTSHPFGFDRLSLADRAWHLPSIIPFYTTGLN